MGRVLWLDHLRAGTYPGCPARAAAAPADPGTWDPVALPQTLGMTPSVFRHPLMMAAATFQHCATQHRGSPASRLPHRQHGFGFPGGTRLGIFILAELRSAWRPC